MVKANEAHDFLIASKNKVIKAAIFTAHPDDETIWMGGTILLRKDWKWRIFVATHSAEDERGIELQKAVNEYKIQSGNQQIDYNFIDVMQDTQEEDRIIIDSVTNKLNNIELSDFDIIFTHNVDGEYDHINHKILGTYFKNKRKDGLNIWHFFCPAIQNPRKKEVGEHIESIFLNPTIMAKKISVFQCAYTSQHSLWTNFGDFMRFQFCSGVEVFTRY
jgi:hypothetical protein